MSHKFTANLYCICKYTTNADTVQICGNFWDTQYIFILCFLSLTQDAALATPAATHFGQPDDANIGGQNIPGRLKRRRMGGDTGSRNGGGGEWPCY